MRIITTMTLSAFLKASALSLLFVAGVAQAQEAEPLEADPPDRAARLSLIRGEVSLQPAGEEDWAPAILNRPLTTGDRLWTEPGARAEIQVGRSAVRLAENTGFSFLNVDDDTIQMRMTAGVLSVTVRALGQNEEIEIDTPNLALSLLQPGTYRIEVNDAGDSTVVKVQDGEAEAHGPSENVVVRADEVSTFRGVERLTTNFDRLGAPDEFDSWAQGRDREYERLASSRTSEYVSPDVTGHEELEDHGTWSSEPEYGYVWTPRHVAVDWSPYRYGRWLWISPWGWTWIDDAPWGYAPFHYGRWAHIRHRWCWVPGPRHVRAVYAPALVGWVDRPGGRARLTTRGIGWFPLGPREVYVPARRFSPRYVERVNIANTLVNRALVRDVYQNHARDFHYRHRGAATVVEHETFTSARRVGERRIRVDERVLDRERGLARAPHIAPGRESRLGDAPRADVRRPPRPIADRQVVVRRAPPAPAAHLARELERRANAPRLQDHVREREARGFDARERAAAREAFMRNRTDRPDRERNVPQATTRAPADPSLREQFERAERERRQQQQDGERRMREQQDRREWDGRLREQQEQARRAREAQRQQQDSEQRELRERLLRERFERRESPREAVTREVQQRERVQRAERPRIARQQEHRQSRPEPRQQEPRQYEPRQHRAEPRPQQDSRPQRSEPPRQESRPQQHSERRSQESPRQRRN
jgi:hypothetical protein